MPKTAAVDPLDLALQDIKKMYGEGSIMKMGEDTGISVQSVSTGILPLDNALGVGGLPLGRMVELFGPESCLDPDTFIQYEIKTADGKRQNHKGGTIETLYYRFHGIQRPGKGNYQRTATVESEYWAPSMNEDGRIIQNRIVDVVSTGEREVFRLRTAGQAEIVATEDHKFFNGAGFTRLGDLGVGDTVFIHNNTPFTKERAPSTYRKELLVKHHPVAPTKTVGGKYVYHRLPISRAVLEAYQSGLDYDVYVKKLNMGNLNGIRFLDPNVDVHHLDEDCTNNSINNLQIITPTEHGKLHAAERHNNLRFTAVPDVVESIVWQGMSPTYDLKMEDPYNNFVADHFVVHNSGKSTIALHVVASAQKLGMKCAYIDAEYAMDPIYAAALGVDIDEVYISQPDNGEQGLGIIDRLASSGRIPVIVVDSVATLVPKAEIEGDYGDAHVGLQARMMSQALRKLTGVCSTNGVLVLWINQIREKIGVMYGSPEVTPGGRALKFYASVRMDVRRIETLKTEGAPSGNRTRVKVVKNKVAPPFKQAEFDIEYGLGATPEGSLLDLAVEAGAIKKSGAWYVSLDGETIGQGREATKLLLRADPALFKTVMDAYQGAIA